MVKEISGQEEFNKEIKGSDTPVILDTYADWCGPCRMMAPVFDELSKDFKGKLKFLKMNTEGNEGIAGELGVSSIPCFIIFKKGEEADRIIGAMPKDSFKEKINSVLSKK